MSGDPTLNKDSWDEALLGRLNEAVAELEATVECPDVDGQDTHPVIFVVGVPRSGTTPLLQLIVHMFRVAYVTNLSAQFPRAPAIGLWLARRTGLWDREQTFRSRFGRTDEPWGPHEFGYFWRDMVGGDPLVEAVVAGMDAVRMTRLAATLRRMACVAGRPLVLKGFTPGFIAGRLAEALPSAHFVRVRRPAAAVEASLMRMRRELFGSADEWASLKPIGWEAARSRSPAEQVAAQVRALGHTLDRELGRVPADRIVEVEHEMLTEDPARIAREVGQLLARAGESSQPVRPVPTGLLRPADTRQPSPAGRGPGEDEA